MTLKSDGTSSEGAAGRVRAGFPKVLIYIAAAITVFGLAVSLVVSHGAFRSIVANSRLIEQLHVLRGDILLYDETLTMSAKMAAHTGDTRWIARYQEVEPMLENAIEQLIELSDDDAVERAVNETGAANAELVSMETRAFDLVESGRSGVASRLLDSPHYAMHKRAYGEGMDVMLGHVEALNRGTVSRQSAFVTTSTAVGAVALAGLVGIWLLVLVRLRRWSAEFSLQSARRRAAEANVRELNDELEAKVIERTAALAESEARLSRQADIDELTGLATRFRGMRLLDQRIEYASVQGASVALVSLDIRSFGSVNEAFGHTVGDELLITLAGRLERLARELGASVARLGADEFLLAHTLSPAHGTEALIKRVQGAFAEPFLVGKDACHELRVDAFIGLAVAPEHAEAALALLRKADLAKHMAKRDRSGGTFTFHAGIEQARASRRELERGMRSALDDGQFRLHYQPKFDLGSGEIAGAEALLRWTHPELGAVPPDAFIPIAEETGLILEIGDWVLDEAARQVAAWRCEHGIELPVAVNVSSLQLRHGDFLGTLKRVMEKHGLNPVELQVELTESLLLENDTHTRQLVQGIADAGCEIALDDFGTGYSALSYLKFFPFDYVKIDRSFVKDMLEEPRDAALTHSIIAMAHSLGMRVVAEGVELEAHRELLERHGCDLAQGYFFSKPLAADDLLVFVATWRGERRRASA